MLASFMLIDEYERAGGRLDGDRPGGGLMEATASDYAQGTYG
jgi:hypothetical protein